MDFCAAIVGGQLNAGHKLNAKAFCRPAGSRQAGYGVVVREGNGGQLLLCSQLH